tara:strand:- start:312 stop:512 length:201 start_codon:yes stop_codon:yes gene_type:complete
MKNKEMIRHALYDIHEYADLIRGKMVRMPLMTKKQEMSVQSETLRYVNELSQLILKRVEQIKEAIE